MAYITDTRTLNQNTVQNASLENRSRVAVAELSDSPSAIELFSYGLCCVAQGAVLLTYFGLVVFVPIALSQGLFSNSL